jgi:hypothetical protein
MPESAINWVWGLTSGLVLSVSWRDDAAIRINKTFTFDRARGDFPLEPILSGKTLILLTSCGEFGDERHELSKLNAKISIVELVKKLNNGSDVRQANKLNKENMI